MTDMRKDLSIDDLASITLALRILRPKQSNLVCVGVEMPKLNDRSVVFHVFDEDKSDEGVPSTLMISAELLLEMFGATGNVAERNA
jgi:hypothetical protein